MEPCINMGQSETRGVKVGALGKRIRQPMVYRIQLERKTLNAASKNFPRNMLERTLNPPLALSATSSYSGSNHQLLTRIILVS